MQNNERQRRCHSFHDALTNEPAISFITAGKNTVRAAAAGCVCLVYSCFAITTIDGSCD